ncbi:asparagine synthase C-terminal domain-containing protein [Corallococcus sp. M34]|nr:asparagine synthase C-terminal domain-containing protein [Citreicoccus inhibens]
MHHRPVPHPLGETRGPLARLPSWRATERAEPGLAPASVAALLRHALPPTTSLFRGSQCLPVPPPDIARSEDTPRDEDALADALLAHAEQAVRAQLDTGTRDVSLSGGVDSAALCAMAASHAPGRIRAWTMDVHFADAAERANARLMARVAGVEQVDVPIPDGCLPDLFEPAVLANRRVILNARAIASFAFYAEAKRRGVGPALLSGAGADEVMLGNPRARANTRAQVEEDRRLASQVLRPSAHGPVSDAATMPWDLAPWESRLSDEVRHAAWILQERVLPPELCGARAHGLTVHTPYLEETFSRFVLALPTSALMRGDLGKWLFRHAVRTRVPDEVRLARKTPRYAHTALSSPMRHRWLELYRAWLSPHRLEPLQVIDPVAVLALLDDHARLAPEDARAAAVDRLLMRLVSLAMLQAHPEACLACPES